MKKNLILFDDTSRDYLLPLCLMRPVADLRIGILSIREKWERLLDGEGSWITQDYLTAKYPIDIKEDNYIINSTLLPSEALYNRITELEFNQALVLDGELMVARLDGVQFDKLMREDELDDLEGIELETEEVRKINRLWEFFQLNGEEIKNDFEIITHGRQSAPVLESNTILGEHPIFLEEGASVEASILNASEGPIYIGKDSIIMEGSMIRGPFALLDHGIVKMGAKIYSDTTIGRYSKAGGEIQNSIIQDYSNKGHDGYLGNSLLGSWCNIGADSNTSNLKNNYDEVKLYQYPSGRFEKTGTSFCGLVMGDHSKCGINTMFNTGTVIGVSANIFGSGYPRNFIPSFAWGGAQGYSTYQLQKALDTASRMMARRGIELSVHDYQIFNYIFDWSQKSRRWEKA